MSSIEDFTLDIDDLGRFGRNLSQPESVVAERDGTLWVSDKRAALTRIDPDGTQTLLGEQGGEPNGLAMDDDGNLLVANLTNGALYRVFRDGREEVVLDEIDGESVGAVNFPLIDSRGRLWISVTCRRQPWFLAAADPQPDGYILLLDEKRPRIVADGFYVANEIRFDESEEFLYVAETMKRRVRRMPVTGDGEFGEPETFGPENLGPGAYTDGLTFDSEGNLWVATVMRNGLQVITPDGDAHVVFEDPNEDALETFRRRVEAGELEPQHFLATAGERIQFPTSVTFAGDDLRTAYVGSLAMPHLLTFRSPVPGTRPRHWR